MSASDGTVSAMHSRDRQDPSELPAERTQSDLEAAYNISASSSKKNSRTEDDMSAGGRSGHSASKISLSIDGSQYYYSAMRDYLLCINLDLPQYRFMLALTLCMNVLFLIVEVLDVVYVDQHSSIRRDGNAVLCLIETILTSFICVLLAKLIYKPSRRSPLASATLILISELIYIIQFVMYYAQFDHRILYIVISLFFLFLQLLSAMLLYRYWEFVTYYYNEGEVDLGAIVADISLSRNQSHAAHLQRLSELSTSDAGAYTPPPHFLTPYGITSHKKGFGAGNAAAVKSNGPISPRARPMMDGETSNRNSGSNSARRKSKRDKDKNIHQGTGDVTEVTGVVESDNHHIYSPVVPPSFQSPTLVSEPFPFIANPNALENSCTQLPPNRNPFFHEDSLPSPISGTDDSSVLHSDIISRLVIDPEDSFGATPK